VTTIRQLIQTSPAKAIELFGRLVETSGSAVRTRERLFSDLRDELELQMRLEEQHLFPVLKKHKETKELVADAVNDNKQTRKALAELEKPQRKLRSSQARSPSSGRRSSSMYATSARNSCRS
jgi:hemerythrin HHE cation binding domain-containing protein